MNRMQHLIANSIISRHNRLSEHLPAPLERVGTKDTFGLSGTMDELFDYFGLRAANIAQAARAAVERRS